ncbi:NACHT and WD domain protein [Annulohypoxylon maeteangense]|uniref:NACHT and WD domain protein n=1 Tax=Annulohypoxylon maeteangense TaxID=1927788 RepID=UPI0020083841|nr:NACHT and WD domain protein [Annulohypoxylon maeteangense]KAI0886353.1 NACHT and WD domain protein [Annulohypoxylon maeteangense]
MSDTLCAPKDLSTNLPTHSKSSPAAHNSTNSPSSSSVAAVEPVTFSKPSLTKRFTSSLVKKRSDKDDEEGIRGPTGLRILHSSPEPLVDLIFVHGLRGGSIKTWRKGDDPRMFWPQLWLPMEPGLRNVNVHSFGYDSDWASTKSSILNVHDFGQALLEEMRNSSHLRENIERPIILLGHSMGGLVVKKAFILARDVLDFRDRIKCIFFLATPHRGSDYAAILNNILAMSGIMSSRQYIDDLTTGSISTSLINDDFKKYTIDTRIFSFYETLRMNLGVSSGLIVERSSAILGKGFPNERVQYMNANHRDICKFESKDDPNYITLKNALSSAVEDLLKDDPRNRLKMLREQMSILKSYLSISDPPDDHFPAIDGSCQWIDSRDDFRGWRDAPDEFSFTQNNETGNRAPSIFWVHANPGTGKTYLAAHVVSQLCQLQLECAYYYFHAGNKSSKSLGELLRSIAYQMASSNESIRKRLTSLYEEGSCFNADDSRTIWTKVFKKGVFQSHANTPQYWVIDAIDECDKYQEFFTLIRGEKPSFPLRIFITSRKVPDLQRLCCHLEGYALLKSIEIPFEDSMADIESYICDRIENLPIDAIADKHDLSSRILQRSNACFLWVRLVLDKLEQVYSNEGILQILQSIPEGMVPYYERTTKAMSENKLEKHIAQAILLWTVASYRDLTTTELSHALELDINTTLPSAKSAVEGLCGQFISVDPGSGLVSLVHTTAREFLLSENAGDFNIFKPLAHERIALACLQVLCSAEMQPPRSRRLLSANVRQKAPSPLLDYAITQFSEHVYGASIESDKLLLAMDKFFKLNVLSWIARVALKGDLQCLIRASKNLKTYLGRKTKYRSPVNSQMRNIDGWSMDLSRIVTKFGAVLLQDPSSIYFIIPPLCPSNSAIYQQFGKRPDGLAILGYRESEWDDCIASVSFGDDSIPSTVFCGENVIAVGMESGDINLYNHRDCQQIGHIQDKRHPIDLVHLTSTYIAACTTRSVVVRDLEGNTIWEQRIRFRCILLSSSSDFLVAVSQHGHLLKWNLLNGELLEDQTFSYQSHDSDSKLGEFYGKAPFLASISPDAELLALTYTGGTICLWDIQTGELIGWAADEENKLAAFLFFNPNHNLNLLLVIYTNHDLSLYDTWSGSLANSCKASTDMGILSASCSLDGRTFATIDSRGNLQIWDFESLSLLYHVLSPASSFRILSFTSDGYSIVDVTDSDMCIWSPAILVRKNIEDEYFNCDDGIQPATIEGQYESRRTSKITALCAHPSLPIVFAGKYTGQVITFNTQTGKQISVLYSHPTTAFVTEIVASRDNCIASSDVNGNLQVWRLAASQTSVLACESLFLRTSLPAQVTQLCFSADGSFLLVATARSDLVYSIKDGSHVGSLPFDPDKRHAWRWTQGLSNNGDEQFCLINNHVLKQYSANAFPSTSVEIEIHLRYDLANGDVETGIRAAFIYSEPHILVLEVHHNSGYISSSTVFIFSFQEMTNTTKTLMPLNDLLPLCSRHFVGISQREKAFVFLHRDSWLCSIDLENIMTRQFSRHFFVPNEYTPSHYRVFPIKSADDNLVFCLHGELAIIKNGLKFREIQVME